MDTQTKKSSLASMLRMLVVVSIMGCGLFSMVLLSQGRMGNHELVQIMEIGELRGFEIQDGQQVVKLANSNFSRVICADGKMQHVSRPLGYYAALSDLEALCILTQSQVEKSAGVS